jgi:tRNA pseudouridine38-40 synthase
MFRYFLNFSYDGTAYHGWQIQENANTVQAEINRALSTLLRMEMMVVGAGRTDTGVHARAMTAHFDSVQPLLDLGKIKHQLNGLLPPDIAVKGLDSVTDEAHARFDALSRSYAYKLIQERDPFQLNRAYYHSQKLDFSAMNAAANFLMEVTDFSSFSKANSDTKTNDCVVTEAVWIEGEQEAVFHITANRFLRNMVRAIVGTLLDVGGHKIELEEFRAIIETKQRSKAGFSVPAHGLYLTNIVYPDTCFKMNENE